MTQFDRSPRFQKQQPDEFHFRPAMMAYAASLVAVSLGVYALTAQAQQPANNAVATKVTYVITGLHCPPCTRTVASSLERIPGVKGANVDWNSKSAKLTLDESVISAQKLAQSIAATPHMMGGSMHYGGWLALSVPSVVDEKSGKSVQDTLSKVPGVAKVSVYPKQHTVAVQFAGQGNATSQQLIEALAAAGVKASTY